MEGQEDNLLQELLLILQNPQNFVLSPAEIVINITLAFVLSVLVAKVYRRTHTGLSYSQSFTMTIVFISVIISIVMMVIGASIVRAFALLGALSMIRFRTVVKDTKDTAYIFAALAIGMACGTGAHLIAVIASSAIMSIAYILQRSNFGLSHKIDYILRFVFDQNYPSAEYASEVKRLSKQSSILHIEPSGDNKYLILTYTIMLKRGKGPDEIIRNLSKVPGVSEVILENVEREIHY